MSAYTTSRRRHRSCLFQKMETEIKKIERKLSAAKESYFQSKKENYPVQPFDKQTTRKKPFQNESYRQIHQAQTPLKTKFVNSQILPKPTQQSKSPVKANKIIIKLEQQNKKLRYELGQMENLCRQSSYNAGFLQGEVKETNRRLEEAKEKQAKERIYLTALVEHYKKKEKKYRQIYHQRSESNG